MVQHGVMIKKVWETIHKASLKLAINILFNLPYFSNFGILSSQQIIGIHMGFDPIPIIAHLFLYYYENKWPLHTKKRDLKFQCL